MSRIGITSAKRIVIKIGSSSLTGSAGSALDEHAVTKIVDLVASLKKRGAEVVLVSSGAIAAGLAPLGLTTRPRDLVTQQAAASVGQGLLIARYNENFSHHKIVSSQVLLTTEDIVRRWACRQRRGAGGRHGERNYRLRPQDRCRPDCGGPQTPRRLGRALVARLQF